MVRFADRFDGEGCKDGVVVAYFGQNFCFCLRRPIGQEEVEKVVASCRCADGFGEVESLSEVVCFGSMR